MKTLIIVVLILLSVLTMPLSLKKALDRKHHNAQAWPGQVYPEVKQMNNRGMTIVIPQWQGGGEDRSTYEGAYAFLNHYLEGKADAVIEISREPVSPLREGVLGLDDILAGMRNVKRVLNEESPGRIFTVGGGCDADAPCAAWLNKVYDGDLAVVYIDSHGDLNTPDSSESHLYYGMSLRALAGESAEEILEEMPSAISPRQLFTCAMRNLDPEEIRFKGRHAVDDFTVAELADSPQSVANAIRAKGFHNIYIHIDLDALDPGEFALTPVPEPDGMTKEALLNLCRSISEAGNIVGFGLLEYSGTESDFGDPFLEELAAFATEHIKGERP